MYYKIYQISPWSKTIIIMGDFNFPDFIWPTLSSSSNTSMFCDFIFHHNLSQVYLSQHIKVSILDLHTQVMEMQISLWQTCIIQQDISYLIQVFWAIFINIMNFVWIYFIRVSALTYQYCITYIAQNTWIVYDKTYLIHWKLLFVY